MKSEVLIDITKKDYWRSLVDFYSPKNHKSGFCHLRGRRRVGKTSLLTEYQKKHSLFYFSGKADESKQEALKRMLHEWALFYPQSSVIKYQARYLSWENIFDEMTEYAKSKPLNIAFDEIQWLAKSKSGFVGTIKNKWLDFEKTTQIKLVICGSSNKFFSKFTGGEEQILRGMKTRSDIHVLPFTLRDLKHSYFPNFKKEELIFIQMLFGGIPYYLRQMEQNLNFVQALNKALFIPESIFLEEVDEILKLELNGAGVLRTKKLLSYLGIQGRMFQELARRSRMPPSTLSELLEKLCEYKIVLDEKSFFKPELANKRGQRLRINDFYLNTYYQVIHPNLTKIRRNKDHHLLINEIFNWPSKFYYVENFSGIAFENFVKDILSNSSTRSEGVFQKLHLEDVTFEIGTHFDSNSQIDIVVDHCDDQQIRLIECKWTSNFEMIKFSLIEFEKKVRLLNLKNPENVMKAVAIPFSPNKALIDLAHFHRVILITADDFFENEIA